jgi:hypothetical protein
MSKHLPSVSGSDEVSQEGNRGQRTTGEGSESAMAVLRERHDVDHLIGQVTELDADTTEPPV